MGLPRKANILGQTYRPLFEENPLLHEKNLQNIVLNFGFKASPTEAVRRAKNGAAIFDHYQYESGTDNRSVTKLR